MENIDRIDLAKARFFDALTIMARKKAEYSECNSKCVVGHIQVEIRKVELSKVEADVRAAKTISREQVTHGCNFSTALRNPRHL